MRRLAMVPLILKQTIPPARGFLTPPFLALDATCGGPHNTAHENAAPMLLHYLRHYYDFELVTTGWRAALFFASLQDRETPRRPDHGPGMGASFAA